MHRRNTIIAVLLVSVALATGTTATYAYLHSPSGKNNSSTLATVITIPPGSSTEPQGFNTNSLLTGTYQYPINETVTLGVNNTIQWVNNDSVDHTVSAFIAPGGASMFNSGLIKPAGTFSVTLTIPGIYKYTCAWHQWLAGQITVKSK
jgi:hypothetical protein